MKAIKLLTVSALFAGLAALSFAGPSPQFWNQQARNQQAKNQPAQPAKAAKEVKVCANCACCALKK
jgi:hypothetical protein